jgi:FMN phosphatase YigB (HAD superfamily)
LRYTGRFELFILNFYYAVIKAILFDWGNTLMIDYDDQKGPMHKWTKISAVKNSEKCLSLISENIPCYIATNAKDSSKEDIYKVLNIVNIGKYVSDVFCYKEIGYEKPNSNFFNEILIRLSLKSSEIILVGDDLENDYYGAINNGISGILFDPKNKHPEIENRITDLLEIVKFL